MEKVQLDKQTKDMEIKLEELRERMSQEKEEREWVKQMEMRQLVEWTNEQVDE